MSDAVSKATVPVPVELLEALTVYDWSRHAPIVFGMTSAIKRLQALIPKPDPNERAVEAMAQAIASFDGDHKACDACRERARRCLSALLDLGWTPATPDPEGAPNE